MRHRTNYRIVTTKFTSTVVVVTAAAAAATTTTKMGKVFPYSLPSVGPGADPGVQAVSPQVT